MLISRCLWNLSGKHVKLTTSGRDMWSDGRKFDMLSRNKPLHLLCILIDVFSKEIKIWDFFGIFSCSHGQEMRSCRERKTKVLGIKGILMFLEKKQAYKEAEKEKLEKQWTLLLQKAKKRELQAGKSIFPVS